MKDSFHRSASAYVKKMTSRIIIRADGNARIGLGHIFRGLALAEILKDQFECVFFIKKPAPEIRRHIISTCPLVEIISDNLDQEIIELKRITKTTDIFVIDGYDFKDEYQSSVKKLVKKLVLIDDLAKFFLNADVIINHGGGQMADRYKTADPSKVLLGFNYLILREVFLKAAMNNRNVMASDSAFICMGGADPGNITSKILKACLETDFLKTIIVVLGSAFKDTSKVYTQIDADFNKKEVTVVKNADAFEMERLISKSSIAICPSSTVALEVCSVQAGLISGTTAANQESIHGQILASKCCISVGDFNSVSIDKVKEALIHYQDVQDVRSVMKNQSDLIDGKSSFRIKEVFRNLAQDEI